jgi:hypothetical protein
MVTPEMEVKFAGKGVALVTAEAGRAVFKQEMMRRDGEQLEIICGEGPWEAREARIGAIRRKSPAGGLEPLGHAADHAASVQAVPSF